MLNSRPPPQARLSAVSSKTSQSALSFKSISRLTSSPAGDCKKTFHSLKALSIAFSVTNFRNRLSYKEYTFTSQIENLAPKHLGQYRYILSQNSLRAIFSPGTHLSRKQNTNKKPTIIHQIISNNLIQLIYRISALARWPENSIFVRIRDTPIKFQSHFFRHHFG